MMANSTANNSTPKNGRPQTLRSAQTTIKTRPDTSNSQYPVLLARLNSIGFGRGGSMRTVGVTSSRRREGVTTVACNLALYAASCHDWRILLVDGNHANPTLHHIFQLPPAPGLADLINLDAEEIDCIHDMSSRSLDSWPATFKQSSRSGRQRSRFVAWRHEASPAPYLSVMPAGNSDPILQRCGNLDNDRVLDFADTQFDLVLVDLPAAGSADSSGIPFSHLDGVLFVLEAETTSDLTAQKSIREVRNGGGNVIGVALNKCRTHLPKWVDRALGD